MGTLPSPPEPIFSKDLSLQISFTAYQSILKTYIIYSILHLFAIILDNDNIVTSQLFEW